MTKMSKKIRLFSKVQIVFLTKIYEKKIVFTCFWKKKNSKKVSDFRFFLPLSEKQFELWKKVEFFLNSDSFFPPL